MRALLKRIIALRPVKNLAAALCLLPAVSLSANAAFTDLGAGARAPGLGNAFAAIADDVYAVYYNPAGLPLLTQPELAAAYTKHLTGLSDGSNLGTSFVGYAQPLGGARGTMALAWQQFSLDGGLYQDQALSLSYGNKILKDLGPGDLYAGVNLKMLSRSFGNTPEAANAMDGLVNRNIPDPVLSGKRSVSVPDLDLGFLYRMYDKYSAGLFLGHVTRPDVAFDPADSDTLPLSVKFGINRRSLLSNAGVQYETRQSPLGARDQRLTLGLERWFPWLLVGNVGARAALTLGSRDFQQVSAGASYRNRQISVDYSFSLPLNSVTPAAGSHRVSFSMRFGSSPEPEESVISLLAAMRRLKGGNMPEPAVQKSAPEAAQKALLEKYSTRAKSLQTEARYREALDQLTKAVELSPGDVENMKAFARLNFVATMVRALPEYKTDQAQLAWHQGILAYLAGDDVTAVEKVSKAFDLRPEAENLAAFLSQLEFVTGLRRAAAQGAPGPGRESGQLLAKAAAAIEGENYREAIELSGEIIKQDPDNLSAWENLGLSYYAVEDYGNWLVTWEKTYELETEPARWAQLNLRLKALKKRRAQQLEPVAMPAVLEQQLPADQADTGEKTTGPAEPSTLDTRRMLTQAAAAMGKGGYAEAIELSRKVIAREPGNLSAWENLGISYFATGDYPKWVEVWDKIHALEKNPERWEALNSYLNTLRRKFTPAQKAAAAQMSPLQTGSAPLRPAAEQPAIIQPSAVLPAPQEDRQSLYNLGIDYYTSGKLVKARAAFEKLLKLDPGNEPAAKALKRVNEDLRE